MIPEIRVLVLALLAGFLVGVIFSAIKLPLPAPPELAGVLGIVGVYLGYKCWHFILNTYINTQ